ncbi:MAG: 3-oxoacyl-ACP reductase family protein [Desulfobacteraceae bacterium]|jgi:3-oxoacyl-[acyl-carrier protein] reductase
MRLKHKTALITGGARGIGAATAFVFAEEGAKVGLVDLREEALKEIEAKAKGKGYEFKTFSGDVTEKDQVERVIDEFVQTFGRIDILVNNAGIVISRPFLEKTVEDWERTLAVNLVGVFLCSQAAAKHMLDQDSGKIIHISSIRGIEHCGREGIMDYSASKIGVISLTKNMAKALAPNINVNCVAPGHTKTEMTNALPEEIKRNMIEGSFLKRMAEPEDIAKAILFLASNDADFITGQVLLVDGGFSLKET